MSVILGKLVGHTRAILAAGIKNMTPMLQYEREHYLNENAARERLRALLAEGNTGAYIHKSSLYQEHFEPMVQVWAVMWPKKAPSAP